MSDQSAVVALDATTIGTITEQVNAELSTLNGYKPAQEREVDDNHPLVRFAAAAAASTEETGSIVMAEAKHFETVCAHFAAELRRSAAELAHMANQKLRRIHAAGKALQAARETYLHDDETEHGRQ